MRKNLRKTAKEAKAQRSIVHIQETDGGEPSVCDVYTSGGSGRRETSRRSKNINKKK